MRFIWKGLLMTISIPLSLNRSASILTPHPVTRATGIPGSFSLMIRATYHPEISGMLRSVNTRSKRPFLKRPTACLAFAAEVTVCPA